MGKNKKISALLLNKVLELLPTGIILIDSRDIIQFINKEVSILFSMNLDFIGSNIRDIFKKVLNSISIIDSDKGFISDIIDRNEVVRKYLLNKDISLNYINCDNSEFFVSLYAFRITVGNKEYIALFVEDKTSQRNIEIKLIHNRDLFQTILESTGDLYVFFDREGKIIEINEKSAKLVGLSKNEIIGRSIWDFIDGKDESQYSKLVKNLTATGESATILDRRYGIILERSFYPIKDENGKVINAVIISRDVTERVRDKELEEDIERMIRHDLKAPLNTILGFPKILLSECDLSEEHRTYLKLIEEAGYRMLNTIDMSLDIYKMEKRVYELNPVKVDLLQIINTIANEQRVTINIKKNLLDIFVDGKKTAEEENYFIKGESLMIYSMLSNLIVNAIEASPERDVIKIFLNRTGKGTDIRISNSGVINESIRDFFFCKYVTFGKKKGTGLGTYSAKLIVETHGGTINFKSSIENGTDILIFLP